MKKFIKVMALLAIGAFVLTGCSSKGKNDVKPEESKGGQKMEEKKEEKKKSETKEKVDLTVFAAASMTESLEKLAIEYTKENPNVNVVYNFDSSGTLKTQIENGANADIFISAGQKQMNALDVKSDKEKNPKGLDFVKDGSRINFLENKAVLVVPKDNPKNIKSFDDLKKGFENGDILFAMGNSDVPVGQYTKKILDYMKLKEEDLVAKGIISYGSNVKEVASQVKEASVDAGVVYQTDAKAQGLDFVDTATKEMCGEIIYPLAIIKTSKLSDEAQKFVDFLKSDKASEVFKDIGFTPVK